MVAGTAAYCVGNLRIPGCPLPWEAPEFRYPDNLASPLQIEIEASNGASDYGNKFGEPVITGPAGAGGGAGEGVGGILVGCRCFAAVVSVAVDPGWRDQAGEGVEKLEGREGEEGAAIRGGPRGLVQDPADADGLGRALGGTGSGPPISVPRSGWAVPSSRFVLDAEAVEGEGRPGAVAEESLPAGAVRAVDTDGGVQAEAAGALPGEHVVHGVGFEEAAAVEEAEDAALEDGREGAGVVGGEVGGLVEADLAALGLGEDAVEDHDVEVEVGVEGGAEAVEEGDGADLSVGAGAGTVMPKAGADSAEQDPEHCAGKGGVVMEEGADPLGHREHPLADRQRRQDDEGNGGAR